LPPFTIVDEAGRPVGKMQDGDTVIYYDFRADRAVQFTEMMTATDFPYFERGDLPQVYYAGMVEYDKDRHLPEHTLVEPPKVENVLAEFEVEHGVKRFVISESIKFGHVTFYFNGNKKGVFDSNLEEYFEVPGKTGETWQFPWMKSDEITDKLVEKIKSGQVQSCLVNYPNGDMVGHEADLESGIVAMEAVDIALKRILRAVDEAGGVALITADHGNLEELYYLDENGKVIDKDGEIMRKTSHTTNLVPFIIYDNTENAAKYRLKTGDFGLANVAATVAMLHGLAPRESWAESLIDNL
jgi:2,3-bisphosphoglycerate-independent phosphoglycerate mutase